MAKAKSFQAATVRAALRCFADQAGSRRFLVADEVGLGKTVVARSVLEEMCTGRRTPLVVYYITNGQRIAHQNRNRLVDFLEPGDQEKAVSKADRLGLIPLNAQPKGSIALYSLTPGTSFPGETAGLHAGRKEERAFLMALLGRTLPHLVRRFPADTLRRNVKQQGWDELVARYRAKVGEVQRLFVRAFRNSLFKEFAATREGQLRDAIAIAASTQSAGRFVGRLRRALAHAVLTSRPPDIVVLDEFQRYKDLLIHAQHDRLVAALLNGSGTRRAALLLLSATPYKLFATRWQESQSGEAHQELFELLKFLADQNGEALKERASGAFSAFGKSLRDIAAIDDVSLADESTKALIQAARARRDELRSMIAPYISRTERELLTDDDAQTELLPAALEADDIRTFRHLAQSFSKEDRSYAVPYWLSVPLPSQSLGDRYQAWKRSTPGRDGSVTKLTLAARNRFAIPSDWPHPKLRALREIVKPEMLALPWVAPSSPWWPLSGPWAGQAQGGKLLLFSRFKATPQSIAALTSLSAEAKYLKGNGKTYAIAWRQRRLQPGPSRLPTLALFHPSPLLIEQTDPIRAFAGISPRREMRRQLTDVLYELGVKVRKATAKERARHQPVWRILSALEQLGNFAELTGPAWRDAAKDDQRLKRMVTAWHKGRAIDWVSERELDDLVTVALSYPGVVLGRALRRHNGQPISGDLYARLVSVAWHGLRTYLDNPVFWARLPKGTPVSVLPRACLQGGLEAVLDEHFWIRGKNLSGGAIALLDDLQEAFGLTTGGFAFHVVPKHAKARIRVRCHAAVAFGSTEDKASARKSERTPRSDEIRTAFNTPFWPHVLATTSVGQEGLDFHTWCRRVAHWDLCASPLELEQREGRIQRFGGLMVRRHLASSPDLARAAGEARQGGESPWNAIERVADELHSDKAGLSPWWTLEGAHVSRYVFDIRQGRDAERFRMLKEQRLIYRLALGQPNQEDMIDVLARGNSDVRNILKSLVLNISAFDAGQSVGSAP